MAEHPFQPLNPALRLPPSHARSHSRSSSRSPERRSWFFTHELDPLLNNLSPQSTLQALSTTDSVPTDEKTAQDLLAKSIAEVTTTERALGIRAAVAAQKLREWHVEITSWDWPRGEDVKLGKGFIPPITDAGIIIGKSDKSPSATRDDFRGGFLGSLPESLVELYSARIDEIKDGMDALDVDELKEHVLNAHIPSRSRPSSSNSVVCTATQRLSYVQLSDFTAVITATILQALPWLSRLNTLLNTWDVRLVVLWQIPGLLESLRTTRTALDASLESLKSGTPPSENDALFSQSSFRAARQNLEYLVGLAGSSIDRILDSLEGREDSLPEVWIDDMESIEADFGNWVVEAEKLAIRNEWSRMNIPKSIQTLDKSQMPTVDDQSKGEHPIAQQSIESGPSSNTVSPAAEQSLLLPQNESKSEQRQDLTSSTDTVDNPRVSEPETSELSSESEQSDSKPPNERNEDEQISQIEPPLHDGESIPSTESSSSSYVHPNPSSVSDESIATRNQTLETSMQSADENASVESIQDSISDLTKETCPKQEPDLRKTSLGSVNFEAEPTGSQQVEASETESTSQDPQSSNLDKSLDILPEDTDSPSQGETANQVDSLRFENSVGSIDSSAGSPDALVTPQLARAPFRNEEQHSTASPATAATCSPAQPSPEINITSFSSPAQSDDGDISPRNTAFGGRQDNMAGAPDTTESAAQFPSKQNSQEAPKKPRPKPGPLDLGAITTKSHRRNISRDSFATDCSSGASSPEIKDAQTATSHGSPMVVEATARWTQSKYSLARPSRTNSATLQDPTLYRRTTEPPSSAESLELKKTTSLPLQRFIDEDFDHLHGEEELHAPVRPAEIKRASVTSIAVRPKAELKSIVLTRKGSSSSVSDVKTGPALRHSTSNLSQYSDTMGGSIIEEEETSRPAHPNNSTGNLSVGKDSSAEEQSPLLRVFDRRQRSTQSPTSPVSPASPVSPVIPRRSSKRLSKRPDSRSSGLFGQRNNKPAPTTPTLASPTFSPLTPVNSNTKPTPVKSSEEQLEEKISSILTTIPAKIKLAPASDNNLGAPSSIEASRKRESFGSASPRSTPTRSSTPTPSLTLTPAFSRSKRTHAHSGDEPSVRLYHLHRGGKSAPVKLFVRPVGENGERVMVRVGGGWADLGEYLREYAVHHGHRTASDGRFDVQNLPTNSSPAYSSPATTITPTPNNGRSTPISRPGSALSARPSSSLAVRKTRKSTVSGGEGSNLTSANVQRISEDTPPLPPVPKRHRLSMSSTTSAGLTSAAGDSPYSSVAAPSTAAHSTPLGLSGPKPKARHVSMTPENEAWVEGVIGQARKTSSSLKPKRSIPGFRSSRFKLGKDDSVSNDKSSNETKTRSVSDIGTLGLNRRVFLRGLGKEKEKEKD